MKPFFSIITPVYNRANLVGETIQSVLNQDFLDFELILVDDKSTDNSLEVLHEFAKKDTRIKVVEHLINKGRCIARNTGLEHAVGQWICYLDSDDFYHKNHLSTFHKLINQFPNQHAFATEQSFSNLPKKYNHKKFLQDQLIIEFKDFIESNPISANQLCYHNSLHIHWANENIPISEDWLFHRQLALKTSILKVNTLTTDVREHDQRSLSLSSTDNFVKWNLYAVEYLFNAEKELNPHYKNRIYIYIHLLIVNIYLSLNQKDKAWNYFKLVYLKPLAWINILYYKALIKFVLNLFK